MENLPQLSNVFCILVLCSAVIIYKKVIELLASTVQWISLAFGFP